MRRRAGESQSDVGSLEGTRRIRRVIVETERTFTFRSRERETVWCLACGAEVVMTGVETAAREGGLSEMAIYQLVESGAVHSAEAVNGHVLVCLNSLLK